MIENYNGGYKKALLDVKAFIEDLPGIEKECRSKKQYKTMLSSLLKMLLANPKELENFKNGTWEFIMNRESKEISPLKNGKWESKK